MLLELWVVITRIPECSTQSKPTLFIALEVLYLCQLITMITAFKTQHWWTIAAVYEGWIMAMIPRWYYADPSQCLLDDPTLFLPSAPGAPNHQTTGTHAHTGTDRLPGYPLTTLPWKCLNQPIKLDSLWKNRPPLNTPHASLPTCKHTAHTLNVSNFPKNARNELH